MTYKEIEEKLKAIEGVSNVKYYALVSNWGWTFEKNGKHYDLRRWENCYGEDLGWQVFGTKSEEDTEHFAPINSVMAVLEEIDLMK